MPTRREILERALQNRGLMRPPPRGPYMGLRGPTNNPTGVVNTRQYTPNPFNQGPPAGQGTPPSPAPAPQPVGVAPPQQIPAPAPGKMMPMGGAPAAQPQPAMGNMITALRGRVK